jgi:hypothetical protein
MVSGSLESSQDDMQGKLLIVFIWTRFGGLIACWINLEALYNVEPLAFPWCEGT